MDGSQLRGDLLHAALEDPWGGADQKGSGAVRRSDREIRPRRFPIYGEGGHAVRDSALAWPGDGRLVIQSLALNSPHYRGEIARIGPLGSESNLVWSRNAGGVTISLPEKPPCDYAYVFKINPLGA